MCSIRERLDGALVDRTLSVFVGILRRFCCGERLGGLLMMNLVIAK